MSNGLILKKLKENSGIKSAKLPSTLNYNVDKGILTIEIPEKRCIENMQNDNSAFEGWALILKCYIKEISTVMIQWDVPTPEKEKDAQHYQRFLYRVKKFSEAYNWVKVHPDNLSCLGELRTENGKIFLNIPSQDRSRNCIDKKSLNDFTEYELEEFILSHKPSNANFLNFFNLKSCDNQLPVGVFFEKVSNSTKIFTGGKSAIDIWGINNNDEICLFELKNAGNNKIGALTEMLFYSYIIKDVIDGKMNYNNSSKFSSKDIKESKDLKCYLLSPSLHPLNSKKVLDLMNQSTTKIKYDFAQIKDSDSGLEFSIN